MGKPKIILTGNEIEKFDEIWKIIQLKKFWYNLAKNIVQGKELREDLSYCKSG